MRAFALAMLTLALTAGCAFAQDYQAGKQYHRVEPPQPTATEDRIELVEFFSYGCSHCFEFAPKLHSWLEQAGKGVELVRVPVTFGRSSWALLAKAYYAEKALNVVDQIHEPLFEAIHVDGRRFADEQALAEFFAQHGVDRQAVLDAFDSFAVDVDLRRAERMVRAYKVRATPSLAVAGKYLVDPGETGGQQGMLDVVDFLIDKERSLLKR
ncbi:thiol:disulfide interchange protein DsbA/DsbL [Nitrococcus mobilis]|uniref:Thiol:disulfide interchange protein n=1 Tax=Nitrococcus mobilis Nb-231 TaxID=314278 RepID=A4BNX9_9GAMM|nr:thiol:disulfide interchange protein DsbA/DsbL [Nitrococcus mobilis]EAR22928.1 DSBA oxidoreductase [Nitrococcus mobilis Nb-231]